MRRVKRQLMAILCAAVLVGTMPGVSVLASTGAEEEIVLQVENEVLVTAPEAAPDSEAENEILVTAPVEAREAEDVSPGEENAGISPEPEEESESVAMPEPGISESGEEADVQEAVLPGTGEEAETVQDSKEDSSFEEAADLVLAVNSDEDASDGKADDPDQEGSIYVPYRYVVNPVYADLYSEEDLRMDVLDIPVAPQADEYYSNVEDAGEALREGMKARNESIAIGYVFDEFPSNDYLGEIGGAIFEAALRHTGDPVEGDYLRFQYGGWGCSISGSSQGGSFFITYSFSIPYYTTFAQEEEMDDLVEGVLDELNLEGEADYTVIRAVYDYICSHVTYDFDNLGNESYKLQFTAYAALHDGTAVCQGYSVLLYRLLLEAGIDARVISGIGNGGGHAWNITRLGNLYYNMDVTWDAGCEFEDYSYFLRGTSDFYDHYRDEEYLTTEFMAAYPMAEVHYDTTQPLPTNTPTPEPTDTPTPEPTDTPTPEPTDTPTPEPTDTPTPEPTDTPTPEPTDTPTPEPTDTPTPEPTDTPTPEPTDTPTPEPTDTPTPEPTDTPTPEPTDTPTPEPTDTPTPEPTDTPTPSPIENPAPVTGLSALNGATGISIVWAVLGDADGYQISRDGEVIASVTAAEGTGYSDATATENGVLYSYTVRAYKEAEGQTVFSDECEPVSIFRLTAPTISSVTNKTGGCYVKWSKNEMATAYRLYRGATLVATVSGVSYTDTGAKTNGKTYTYRVEAIRTEGGVTSASAQSDGVAAIFLSQPDLSSLTNAAKGVTVKWKRNTKATGYYVYRGSKKVATISGNATLSYTDTGARTNGTKYVYKVIAYRVSGSKTYKSIASGTKTICFLTRAAISSAANTAAGKVTVKWGKNTRATGYQVRYVLGTVTKTVTIRKASTVKTVISKLKKGKTYKFYVRAYKKVDGVNYYGAWSTAKSVKIKM